MQNHGSVFWQAVAYEGLSFGHASMSRLQWAARGSSTEELDQTIPRDDARQCLLSMRRLFEAYLEDEGLKSVNGGIDEEMSVVVERYDTGEYFDGRIVARIDIHREGEIAKGWLSTKERGPVFLGEVILKQDEGAWEFFVRILSDF
jgi:hypothetical protein